MQRALVEYKHSWIRSVVMISFDSKTKNALNELRVLWKLQSEKYNQRSSRADRSWSKWTGEHVNATENFMTALVISQQEFFSPSTLATVNCKLMQEHFQLRTKWTWCHWCKEAVTIYHNVTTIINPSRKMFSSRFT